MNKKYLFILVAVLVVAVGATYYFLLGGEKPVACTMEAKQCPDGSYVGRVPPKCEFAPCPQTKAVNLFYYSPENDKGDDGNTLCSRKGLVSVGRQVAVNNLTENTIKLLLEGKLTEEEKAAGITTEYPLEGLELLGAELKNGVLTLTFSDSFAKTTGGSCRVGILWFQIEATAKQFPEVQQVRFLPEEIFQP